LGLGVIVDVLIMAAAAESAALIAVVAVVLWSVFDVVAICAGQMFI